jgi:hypothetical protein
LPGQLLHLYNKDFFQARLPLLAAHCLLFWIHSGTFGCTIAKIEVLPATTFPPPKVVETSIPSAGVQQQLSLCYPFSTVPTLGANAIILQSLHSAFAVFLLHS